MALDAQAAEGVAVVVPESLPVPADLVVAHHLQNSEENSTRFWVVRAFAGDVRSLVEPGRQKLSLLMSPEQDRPGLLCDMLSVLRRHELNLSRIESRPSRRRPWTYCFYLDLSNGAEARAAVEALLAENWGTLVLGSYDVLPSES